MNLRQIEFSGGGVASEEEGFLDVRVPSGGQKLSRADAAQKLLEEAAQRQQLHSEWAHAVQGQGQVSWVVRKMRACGSERAGKETDVALREPLSGRKVPDPRQARWPRTRLLALTIVGVTALVQPLGLLRLLVWFLVLFLVASVAAGPERVVAILGMAAQKTYAALRLEQSWIYARLVAVFGKEDAPREI